LRDGLREHRIDPTIAATFADGQARTQAGDYDVIILDVRLPGGTGFELCAQLRHNSVDTPVLMLTALDAVDDRVRGLTAGADDYLTKPFAFRELVARLQALARRRGLASTPAILQVAAAALIRATHTLEQERATTGVSDAVEELHIPDRDLYLLDTTGRPLTPARADAWIVAAARTAVRTGRAQINAESPDGREIRVYAESFTGQGGATYVAAVGADRMEFEDQ